MYVCRDGWLDVKVKDTTYNGIVGQGKSSPDFSSFVLRMVYLVHFRVLKGVLKPINSDVPSPATVLEPSSRIL